MTYRWLLVLFFLGACSSEESSDSTPLATDPALPCESTPLGTHTPDFEDRSLIYTSTFSVETRSFDIRIFFPQNLADSLPLVLVSHGGFGIPSSAPLQGHQRLNHLSEALAASGMVAVNITHRPSSGCNFLSPSLPSESCYNFFADRIHDVQFVIDELQSSRVSLPSSFQGTVDFSKIGHVGHSAGAFANIALTGGSYVHDHADTYRDSRIQAGVALSPQGIGNIFEATSSTWSPITTPLLLMIGGDEIDTNGAGVFIESGWRRNPWDLGYLDSSALRKMIILENQNHSDLVSSGSEETQSYVSANTAAFFRWTLGGSGESCSIGNFQRPATNPVTVETL